MKAALPTQARSYLLKHIHRRDTAISTIGVKSVLITKSDVSDDTIEQLTSLLFEKKMSSHTPTLLSLS